MLACCVCYKYTSTAPPGTSSDTEEGGLRGVARTRRTSRGLEKDVIKSFPSFLYSQVKGLKIGKGGVECAICLNEFEDEETLRLMPPCSHAFHADCIDVWLSSRSTCPVCRANLIPKPDSDQTILYPFIRPHDNQDMDLETGNVRRSVLESPDQKAKTKKSGKGHLNDSSQSQRCVSGTSTYLHHLHRGTAELGGNFPFRIPMTSSFIIPSNLSSSIFFGQVRFPATLISGGNNLRAVKRSRSNIVARSLDLPLLPFSTSEVLVPTESKTLHLYEARYLALLEESMKRKKNTFVHFILDPISISDTATEASFAARYGCLVLIENVERLEIGALVSIRGAGRVKISRFLGADPYLSGEVRPIQDRLNYESNNNETNTKISQLKESIKNLNSLEIKLKASDDSPLQTRLFNSLNWAEDDPLVECDESFFPSLQERLSFAAFQPVSGSTQSELSRLQQEKLRAMDMKDTIERLELSLGLIKENISSIAAKLAIQSLDIL
ncbi:hypothetical protein AALP_AA1G315700 [Arabis alpina]|uniref:RING-type E3 ubiquitin transferase n=1 Tax=Arabis alpina TaxID=50452 RepID=A0A087HRY4_ARAAL|nr:hypothetical protein AALP_AA1G315700 [Arabis alpina]